MRAFMNGIPKRMQAWTTRLEAVVVEIMQSRRRGFYVFPMRFALFCCGKMYSVSARVRYRLR